MMGSSCFKTVLMSAGIMLLCLDMSASQNQKSLADRYSISVLGVFDYSRTFMNQGGFDLVGHMPFNAYIEADAGFEFVGPKTLAGTFVLRPKLPLTVGELFLDTSIHLRSFNSFGIGTFSMAASFGYRMDYVSVQAGVQRLLIHDLQNSSWNTGTDIVEPINPILKLAFNLRPATSTWNISLGAGNFTLYQYERIYYPIFFLGGHYDFTDHMTVLAEMNFKPSGIFNYNAHFNGLSVHAGLTYSF